MRTMVLPVAVWLGVLQLPPSNQHTWFRSPRAATRMSAAAVLAELTVMVYRLGVRRQEMYNTKYDVGAEIARHREELTRQFAEVNRRLTTLEQAVTLRRRCSTDTC